jgi:mannose-6-phosphate isomerase-like protein (cupin superfamily)
MIRLLLILLVSVSLNASAQPLSKRVAHNDPANYKQLTAVHAGAGQMKFAELIGRNVLSTNFLYLHAGEIPVKAGIGEHFHHGIEEMYLILDGEAEFTINGRTSKIKGPALVPCKMGDAHAIYNSGSKTLSWLNFAVSSKKARGDNFDLGDNRAGAALDPIPQFVSAQLKRESLKVSADAYPGNGISYRRVFGPEIFSTNWSYVDHAIIPAGISTAKKQLEATEEVYYIIKGTGTINVDSDSVAVKAGDAFYGSLSETLRISNKGKEDLEMLVIGIAVSKQKTAATTNSMVLQMDFIVTKENSEAFEKMYHSIYVPAMLVQQGFLGSKLLRLYPDNSAKEIQAEPTTYNYQIQINFDTETNRRKWVASPQHQIAWPAATNLATEFKWRGYDVKGDNSN